MRRPSQVLAAVVAGGFAVLAMTAVVVVSAPGSGAQTTTPDAVVTLQNLKFNPSSVSLPRAGMTVQWVHHDGETPHSVTFDAEPGSPGFFDSHPNCSPTGNPADCWQQSDSQESYTVSFESGGTFKYHCKIHATMTGEVIVAGGTPPTVTTVPKTSTTKASTATTVGTLTTTSEVSSTTSSSTVESTSTSTTLSLTTQTTAPGSALAQPSSNDDDEPSALLEAVGVILLAAVAAALIPAWRRLT